MTKAEYWQLRTKLNGMIVHKRVRLVNDIIEELAKDNQEIKLMAAELDKIKGIGPLAALEILFSIGMLMIENEFEASERINI